MRNWQKTSTLNVNSELTWNTNREAKAKTGKKTPRQCLRLTSSSVVGLYHSKRSRTNSLALRTRPDNNNLASPSAAILRRSLLYKDKQMKYKRSSSLWLFDPQKADQSVKGLHYKLYNIIKALRFFIRVIQPAIPWWRNFRCFFSCNAKGKTEHKVYASISGRKRKYCKMWYTDVQFLVGGRGRWFVKSEQSFFK